MSYCVRGICLHKREVFVWLGDGPDDDGMYPWVHNTTGPDDHGGLTVCDEMKPATAAEAGEGCADCGHGTGEKWHRWPEGEYTGQYPDPLACICGCPAWVQPPPPPGATVLNEPKRPAPGTRAAVQWQMSREMGIPYNPRWKSPHCTSGSCTYCDNPLCTHRCHGTAIDDRDTPAPPRPTAPVDPGEQAALFELEAIPCL